MESKILKIVIADDHSLIRKGLRSLLESQLKAIIFEAENGEIAKQLIIDEQPNLVLLDVEMPLLSGIEVAKWVQEIQVETTIVFITMYKDESMFNRALDYGVKGYVLKENTVTEILECIKAVTKGNHYISPAISNLLIERNVKSKKSESTHDKLEQLTNAEKNILHLLASMKTSQEIATELNISLRTVQNHRQNICNKLEIGGVHALLKFAIEASNPTKM